MRHKSFIKIIFALALYFLPAPAADAKAGPGVPDFEESFFGKGERDDDGNIDMERVLANLWAEAYEQPYNYEHYSRLAFVYDHMADYENLLEAVRLEVAYLPEDAEGKDAYFGNLARAFLLNGFWEEGKEWLDKADAVNPKNHFNRWNVFKYYAEFKKDIPTAARELKRLNKLVARADRDVYYEAYMSLAAIGEDPAWITDLFRESVRLEPKNPKTHRILAVAVRNSSSEERYVENFPVVMEGLTRALRLDRRYIPTYITIANTCMLMALYAKDDKYFGEALAWFDKAFKVDPKNLRLFYAWGNLFVTMKEYGKAIEKLQYAYDNGLQDDEVKYALAIAYNNKAYSFYEAGEGLDKGMDLIERSLVLAPDDGIILSTKAELLYKLGDYAEAHRYIKMALEAEPDNEDIRRSFKMIEDALAAESAALP